MVRQARSARRSATAATTSGNAPGCACAVPAWEATNSASSNAPGGTSRDRCAMPASTPSHWRPARRGTITYSPTRPGSPPRASLPLALTVLLVATTTSVLRESARGSAFRLVTLTGPAEPDDTSRTGNRRRSCSKAALVWSSFRSPLCACLVHCRRDRSKPRPARHQYARPGEARQSGVRRPPHITDPDNFEHVLDAAPLVAELLTSVAALRVLVTSRAPLRVRGEREYVVGPAPVERGGRCVGRRCGALAGGATVHGTRSRCAARVSPDACQRPHFDRDLSPARCAPARARARGSMAEGANAGGSAAATRPGCSALDVRTARSAERQQTMNATVAWSYRLLDANEQRMFRRLGVCR